MMILLATIVLHLHLPEEVWALNIQLPPQELPSCSQATRQALHVAMETIDPSEVQMQCIMVII